MFCPECGNGLSSDTRFCPSCGASIEGESGGVEPTHVEPEPGGGRRRLLVIGVAVAALLLVAGGAAGLIVTNAFEDDEKAEDQRPTISFENATAAGPAPFTSPADTRGVKSVKISESGGAGEVGAGESSLVCDRGKLSRMLGAERDRTRAWADVLGVGQTTRAVSAHIGALTPKTLTRDTRITAHRYEDGAAKSYQAILQAGTAVLTKDDGDLVTRCRSGSPLTRPTEFTRPAEVSCVGCPRGYNFVVATCPITRTCARAYPDPPPVQAGGGFQKAATFEEPCEVTAVNGDTIAIRRVRGAIACPEAQDLLRKYYARVGTERQGTGGSLRVDGWTCMSAPAGNVESAGSCEEEGRDEGLLTLVKPADIEDCDTSAHGTNVIISSVRNMACDEAAVDARAYQGSINPAFTTPGGFACAQVSGQALGGQWRCSQATRAYRFDFAD